MALSYKNDPESDERLNPYELGRREQAAGSGGAFGMSEKKSGANYEDDNITNAQNREKTPDNPYNYNMSKDGNGLSSPGITGSKIKFFAKKAGPAGGIIGGVIGGLALIGMFFSGNGIMIAIKETLTNYGSAASKVAPTRFEEGLYYRLGGGRDIAKSCGKVIKGVKCLRATVKDEVVKKMRDNGDLRVLTTEVDGGKRHIIQSISYNGVEATDARSLRTAMRNPDFASAMNRAINSKNLVFYGDRWKVKVLNKLKLSRAKVEISGDTDEERRNNINTQTGADISDSDHESRLRADIDERSRPAIEKHKGLKGKIAGLAAGAGALSCLVYNLARVFVSSTKVYNTTRYASFAFLFLRVADQMKNDGDVDPTTAAALGAVLTSPTAKGLTATDSQGYKVAAYGGERKLESFTKRKLLGGSTALKKVDGTIDYVNDAAGKDNVKGICKGLTNPIVGAAINSALCAAAGGGSSAAILTTVFPGLGTAIGGVAGTALCAAVGAALGLVLGNVMGKLINWLMPIAVNSAKDADIDVNNISSVDAGNALAIGAGAVMESTNRSRGLQPGTKEGVEQFQASTSESDQQQKALARYDARDEPFNIKNEYSFMGALVRKTGLIYKPSLYQQLMAASSILVGSPFRLISNDVLASATMPINITREDLEHCPDASLRDVGIDCDLVGGTQYVMKPDIPVEENLNFMIGTHVDNEGDPISDDYKNWIKGCTDERSDPFGTTSTPVEDETDWDTGEACRYRGTIISQNERDQFSTFYYDEAALEDEEYEPTENVALTNSELNLASFNILHIGKGGANWRARLKMAFDAMKENGVTVAGLQEVRHGQNALIQKNHGDTYGIWPKETKKGSNKFSPNPVIWDKSKYTLVEGKQLPIQYDKGKIVPHLIQVELKDSTGNSFYVLSTHDPANVRTGSTAVLTKSRYNNTKRYVEIAKKLQSTGKPFFLVGDFNSPYSGRTERQYLRNTNNRAYCVISSGGIFVNVWDVQDKLKHVRSGSVSDFKCPRPGKTPGSAPIDHIYTNYTGASDSVKIDKVWAVHGGKRKIGSDHPLVIAAVTLPWGTAEDASSGDGPAWPIDKKFYNQNKTDWLGPHGTYSGSWTNGVSGLAVDIGDPPDGSPIYAMYGGKVTRSNLGTSGEPHGLIITSDVQGGKLEIAYAHGPRTNQAQAYNAGDKIMTLGCRGNCTGGHLHMDMAYNGKGVCPQDVFLAMARGDKPNFSTLVRTGRSPCGRI